eukprot:1142153-Pelagomonas_calceolata.AAC.6
MPIPEGTREGKGIHEKIIATGDRPLYIARWLEDWPEGCFYAIPNAFPNLSQASLPTTIMITATIMCADQESPCITPCASSAHCQTRWATRWMNRTIAAKAARDVALTSYAPGLGCFTDCVHCPKQ